MMKDYENENLMPENDGNETESALPTDESDTGSEEVSLSETAEEILKKAGETVLEAAQEEAKTAPIKVFLIVLLLSFIVTSFNAAYRHGMS